MKDRAASRRLRVPSPAMIVACISLAVALSGASYAAVVVPRNSVGTPQLKRGAVTSAKVKDNGLTGADIANGAITEAKISNGAITQAKIAAPATFTSAGLPAWAGCGASPPGFYNNSGSSEGVAYSRDSFGIVHLRGLAWKCGAAPNLIFMLPAGFRPAGSQYMGAFYLNGSPVTSNTVLAIRIDPDGGVLAYGAMAPDTGVWLSGLTFRCAPSGTDGCP